MGGSELSLYVDEVALDLDVERLGGTQGQEVGGSWVARPNGRLDSAVQGLMRLGHDPTYVFKLSAIAQAYRSGWEQPH
ncbi:MAG TPA: hypothetical protein VF114_09730 [Candidatus Limnocylindria bacterium]